MGQHPLKYFLSYPQILTTLQGRYCYTHFTVQEENTQVVK